MAILRVSQLSRAVETGEGPKILLEQIEFELEAGRWLTVIGPSGSGKTTLLRLLNRLDEAGEGRIEYEGRALDDWDVQALRRRMGMLFQETDLLGRTVEENLRLPFELAGETPPGREAMIGVLGEAKLEADLLGRTAEALSTGQKQRVGLARCLIRQPHLLLLDEPTSSLDIPTARGLIRTLRGIQEESGMSCVLVTHRLEEAREAGGTLLVLVEGRQVELGPAEEVFAKPGSEGARRFFEEAGQGSSSPQGSSREEDSARPNAAGGMNDE